MISKWLKFFGITDDSGAKITTSNRFPVTTDIIDDAGTAITAMNPFPVDGDSVYSKDIDTANSSIGDFSGAITDLFDSKTSTITTSVDNPSLTIALKKPIHNQEVSIITSSGNYSNVTIVAKDASGATLETIDDSADSTKYTSNTYYFTTIDQWCVLDISFTTTDDVTLSYINVHKAIHTYAHLHALKPDGTVTAIDATAGGNLKVSIEELESGISVNSNSQLKVTEYNSGGTELSLYYQDPMLIAAHGSAPLISAITKVNKYGKATDGIQTSITDIWDRADATPTQQLWVAPTAARTHQITSSSTADDGTPEGAGAGAQAVRIWGLTSWSADEVSEDVTLNGTANVATANSYVIIHRMKVIEVGSTYNLNVGNITATADTDGTVTAQISAGNGQTLMAIYGIPSTQTAYMTCYYFNSHDSANPGTATEADFSLLINERPDLNETVFLNKSNIGLNSVGSNIGARCYSPYMKINGPAIIKVQALATSADTEGVAEFDLIMIAN